jgi:hypothetical protein
MLSSLATTSATTKRSTVSAGKKGAPSAYLSGLTCTPPTPCDPMRAGALLQRLKLDTPYQLFDTVVTGQPDIVPGDILVITPREFVVRAAGKWGPPGTLFTYLTVEEIL